MNSVDAVLIPVFCDNWTSPVQALDEVLVKRVTLYGSVPPDHDTVIVVDWPVSIGEVAVSEGLFKAWLTVTRSVADVAVAGLFELSVTL